MKRSRSRAACRMVKSSCACHPSPTMELLLPLRLVRAIGTRVANVAAPIAVPVEPAFRQVQALAGRNFPDRPAAGAAPASAAAVAALCMRGLYGPVFLVA